MATRACLLIALACLLQAQESRRITRESYDLHGRPVRGVATVESRSDSEYRRSEMVQSLNGRKVPVQSVEERVITDSPGVKIIERVERRYDPNGRPGPPERVVIEQRLGPAGGSILETRYRTDLNGREQLWERARTEIARQGAVERSETSVERQSLNAALELVEKKSSVTRTADSGSEQEVVVFRRSESGRLYEAARELTEKTTRDGETIENIARYEAQAPGQLRIMEQVVSRTVEDDAGRRSEVDIYSADIAGRTRGEAHLREQRLIERRADSAGGFVETVSVRRPSVNDPKRPGRYEKVSEIACTGDCVEQKAPEPAAPVKDQP